MRLTSSWKFRTTAAVRRAIPLLLLALAACEGTVIEERTLYSSHVTGTVTSTSAASVAGLKVVALMFSSGCDASGGTQGGNSGTTTATGDYSIFPTGYTDASLCVGVQVEKNGVVLGSATGRVAEFRASAPFDTQVINVVIP
jgi:hypothetical protein